jgi:hypothetical protein
VTGELKITFTEQGVEPWEFPIQHPIWVSIGEIETILDHKSLSTHASMPIAEDVDLRIWAQLRGKAWKSEFQVPRYLLSKIPGTFRNIILEWALELEANGVFGDGLAFTAQEKQTATNITFNVIQVIQKGGIDMNVEIGNSNVGILNLGEMWSGSIATSISTLTAPCQYGDREVFPNSTESSKASRNISSQKQPNA